ncbi:MAG: hypothetical protein ACXAC7_20265 [Candidatus Hodarchaeales archaeon]|jgi:hypothetical protein
MTSTIKMNDEVKHRFDKLQARILIETGKKLSQQDLLDLLINHLEENEEEIILRLKEIEPKLSNQAKKNLLALQADFGYDTSSIEQDEIIYEDK